MLLRRLSPLCFLITVTGCSPSYYRQDADTQVYGLLEEASEMVTGTPRKFDIERPIDTLRRRLLDSDQPVRLTLLQALDVAAENSRDFQRQKESLYLAALNLTRARNDFAVRFGGGGSVGVDGVGDDQTDVRFSPDLSASANTIAGTRIVFGFVNTFLRSVLSGGAFDGSTILNLTVTQPLLRGAGADIVREPLTQSERDVVYQMRDFEDFRSQFVVQVVSEYYGVVQDMADLDSVERNYESVRQSRERSEELFRAGRVPIDDLGRSQQQEYTADNQRVIGRNRLETSLDRFMLTLGLPVTAQVELDIEELDRLVQRGVEPVDLDPTAAIAIALERRYDYQTAVDSVEDAGRRVMVSEDALRIGLDFSAAFSVPDKAGSSAGLDWSRVNWAAGFDLDLALDQLVERNAYRSALIALDLQIRNREQAEDTIATNVRAAVRDVQASYESYKIQEVALRLAEVRVDSSEELYAAGREDALNLLDAKDSLLESQLNLTQATVTYAISRMQLMDSLQAVALEPKGLRFDPALPIPRAVAAAPE